MTRVWDINSGDCHRQFVGPSAVLALCIVPTALEGPKCFLRLRVCICGGIGARRPTRLTVARGLGFFHQGLICSGHEGGTIQLWHEEQVQLALGSPSPNLFFFLAHILTHN